MDKCTKKSFHFFFSLSPRPDLIKAVGRSKEVEEQQHWERTHEKPIYCKDYNFFLIQARKLHIHPPVHLQLNHFARETKGISKTCFKANAQFLLKRNRDLSICGGLEMTKPKETTRKMIKKCRIFRANRNWSDTAWVDNSSFQYVTTNLGPVAKKEETEYDAPFGNTLSSFYKNIVYKNIEAEIPDFY